AVRRLVEDRGQVVHARDERGALRPVAVLEVLLDAGVQVPDDRAGLGDGLAFEFQDQAQYAVRGGVLRAHVDDDPLLGERVHATQYRVPVAAGDREYLALGRLAGARVIRAHWYVLLCSGPGCGVISAPFTGNSSAGPAQAVE